MAPYRTLKRSDSKYKSIREMMNSTIRDHPTDLSPKYRSYKILKISEIFNERLERGFNRRKNILEQYSGEVNEKLLFHGSQHFSDIVELGFDEHKSLVRKNIGILIDKRSRNFQEVLFSGYARTCRQFT